MIFCTNCGQQNDDAARNCTHCGTPFGGQRGSTPFTTEPANAGTQQPENPWSTPQSGGLPPQYMQPTPGGSGLSAIGSTRDPIMVLVFIFLTCGIYGIWWLFTYATEVKNALGRQDLNPTTDLLLGFVTCGIWWVFAFYYKYPQLFAEMRHRVGLPPNDITMLTLLLGIFFSPAAIYIIQAELNQIWDATGRK